MKSKKNKKTTSKWTSAKWDKMMDKIVKDRTNKKKIISVNIKGKMTVDEFAEKVREIVYVNDDIDINAEWFVALLVRKFENLDIVIELANHFTYEINEDRKADSEWWKKHKKYTPKINSPKDLLAVTPNKQCKK